jgi:hypothetical protein
LVGAFCTRSSASCRRRLRISIARSRMIFPIETPRVSPWRIERTNERIAPVSALASMFARASLAESPISCSWMASLSSSPSAPWKRVAASRSEPLNAMPASTVVTSRSISSGISASMSSSRFRDRRRTTRIGPCHPKASANISPTRKRRAPAPVVEANQSQSAGRISAESSR